MNLRRHVLPVAGLTLLLLALPAQIVLAHANLVRSDPAGGARLGRAPRRVQVWLSEPLEPGFSRLQVLDASSWPINLGESRVTPDDPTSTVVSLPDTLADGACAVSWRTLSTVDGHSVRGLFTFGVGVSSLAAVEQAPEPEISDGVPLEALGRLVTYLAQTALGEGSLETGQRIYAQQCASCRGKSGHGDGPAAIALRPPPADLRVHIAAGHTDGQLFDWISNGVPATAMPAWHDRLSEEERWHAINYIRTFAPQAAGLHPASSRTGSGPPDALAALEMSP